MILAAPPCMTAIGGQRPPVVDAKAAWPRCKRLGAQLQSHPRVLSMPSVQKNALLPYSAQQVFALVHDIESYPLFLPWCSKSRLDRQEGETIDATVWIDYRGLKQSFSTRNEHQRPDRITMRLLDGPFTDLHGGWQFIALGEQACKVQFELHYAFKSGLLGKMLAPVFGQIASTMVDAFVKRAEAVYG